MAEESVGDAEGVANAAPSSPKSISAFRDILQQAGTFGKSLLLYFEVGGLLADEESFSACCCGVLDRASLTELVKENAEFTYGEREDLKRIPLSNLVNVLVARCIHFFPNYIHQQQKSEWVAAGTEFEMLQQPSAGASYEVVQTTGLDLLADLVVAGDVYEQPTFGSISSISHVDESRQSRGGRRQNAKTSSPFLPARTSSLIRESSALEAPADDSTDEPEAESDDRRGKKAVSPKLLRGWGPPTGTKQITNPVKAKVYTSGCRFAMTKQFSKSRTAVVSASISKDSESLEELKLKLKQGFRKDIKAENSLLPSPGIIEPKCNRIFTNSRYHHRRQNIRGLVARWSVWPWLIVNGHRLEVGELAFFFLAERHIYFDLVVKVTHLPVEPSGLAYVKVIERGYHVPNARHTDPHFGVVYPFVDLRMGEKGTDFCVTLSSLFQYDEKIHSIAVKLRKDRGSRRGHRLYEVPTDEEEERYFVHMPSERVLFKEHCEMLINPPTDEQAILENGGIALPSQESVIVPAAIQRASQVLAEIKVKRKNSDVPAAVPSSKRRAVANALSPTASPVIEPSTSTASPVIEPSTSTTSAAKPSTSSSTASVAVARKPPNRLSSKIRRQLLTAPPKVERERAILVKKMRPILKCTRDWLVTQLELVEACRDRLHGPPAELYLDLPTEAGSDIAREIAELWREPDYMVAMIKSMRRYNKKNPFDPTMEPHSGPMPPPSPAVVPSCSVSSDEKSDDEDERSLLERLQQKQRFRDGVPHTAKSQADGGESRPDGEESALITGSESLLDGDEPALVNGAESLPVGDEPALVNGGESLPVGHESALVNGGELRPDGEFAASTSAALQSPMLDSGSQSTVSGELELSATTLGAHQVPMSDRATVGDVWVAIGGDSTASGNDDESAIVAIVSAIADEAATLAAQSPMTVESEVVGGVGHEPVPPLPDVDVDDGGSVSDGADLVIDESDAASNVVPATASPNTSNHLQVHQIQDRAESCGVRLGISLTTEATGASTPHDGQEEVGNAACHPTCLSPDHIDRSSSLSLSPSSYHPYESDQSDHGNQSSFSETVEQFDAGVRVMGLPFLEPGSCYSVKADCMTEWNSYSLTLIADTNEHDKPTAFLVRLDLPIQVSEGEVKSYTDFAITDSDLVEAFEFVRRQYIHMLGEDDATFYFKPIKPVQGRWMGTLELKTFHAPRPARLQTTPDRYERSAASKSSTSRSRRSRSMERATELDAGDADAGVEEAANLLTNSVWQLILFHMNDKLNSYSDEEIFDKFVYNGGWKSFITVADIPLSKIRALLAKYDVDHDPKATKITNQEKKRAIKKLMKVFTIAGYFRVSNVGASEYGNRFVDIRKKLPI